MRMLLVLIWLFPVLALAQDEPSPMSFDDFEMSEVNIEVRAVQRAKRRTEIDFAEDAIEADLAPPAERMAMILQLAHLQHELGRDEGNMDALDLAIGHYREVLDRLPPNTLQDHVMFFLGFALASRGHDEAQALDTLGEVVRQWPSSMYAPHAQLHIGEIHFERADYAKALPVYQQSASATGFELSGFSLYKAAWTLERLGRGPEARQAMAAVVVDPNRPGLATAALEVLDFWALRDLGHPADRRFAASLVRSQSAPAARSNSCLDVLSQTRSAIASAPLHANVPNYALSMVQCLAGEGRRGQAVSEVRRLEHHCQRGSRWWKANDRAAHKRARELLREAERLVA